MSDRTGIEWCDATWNIVTGCTKVSAGCAHCYAERDFHRPYPGRDFGDVRLHYERLDWPLRSRRPRRIFPCSLSDLFHAAVRESFILGAIAVMANADWHTFLVLTKRPDRMRMIFDRLRWRVGLAIVEISGHPHLLTRLPYFEDYDPWTPLLKGGWKQGPTEMPDFVPPNIWCGTSIENKPTRDARVPDLLKTRAAHKFLSVEPLLEDIADDEVFSTYFYSGYEEPPHDDVITWVIVGGESGSKARPCDVAWIRDVVRQCQAAGVPCFVKQLGTKPRGYCAWPHHTDTPPKWLDQDGCIESVSSSHGPFDLCHAVDDAWWPCAPKLKSRKGNDPAEWPEDLRVRELPR